MQNTPDRFATVALLATARTAILAAGATTEVVVFEHTKGAVGTVNSEDAEQACILTVVTNQTLTFYHRHRSDQTVATPAANQWHDVKDDAGTPASPTSLVDNSGPTAAPHQVRVNFFGDAHRLVLKTGATPPTVLELSLRFVDRAGIRAGIV